MIAKKNKGRLDAGPENAGLKDAEQNDAAG